MSEWRQNEKEVTVERAMPALPLAPGGAVPLELDTKAHQVPDLRDRAGQGQVGPTLGPRVDEAPLRPSIATADSPFQEGVPVAESTPSQPTVLSRPHQATADAPLAGESVSAPLSLLDPQAPVETQPTPLGGVGNPHPLGPAPQEGGSPGGEAACPGRQHALPLAPPLGGVRGSCVLPSSGPWPQEGSTPIVPTSDASCANTPSLPGLHGRPTCSTSSDLTPPQDLDILHQDASQTTSGMRQAHAFSPELGESNSSRGLTTGMTIPYTEEFSPFAGLRLAHPPDSGNMPDSEPSPTYSETSARPPSRPCTPPLSLMSSSASGSASAPKLKEGSASTSGPPSGSPLSVRSMVDLLEPMTMTGEESGAAESLSPDHAPTSAPLARGAPGLLETTISEPGYVSDAPGPGATIPGETPIVVAPMEGVETKPVTIGTSGRPGTSSGRKRGAHAYCEGRPHSCPQDDAFPTLTHRLLKRSNPSPADQPLQAGKQRKIVQIGSNTVRGSGCMESLLLSSQTTPTAPDFISQRLNMFREQGTILVGPVAIQVQSFLQVAQPGQGFSPPVPQVGDVITFAPAPIPAPLRASPIHASTVGRRPLSEYDPAAYTPWAIGGKPSQRALSNSLQPVLRLAANAAGQHAYYAALTDELRSSSLSFDNMYLYAKLVFYALAIDLGVLVGAQPIATPYPAVGAPNWINLDQADIVPGPTVDAIQRGDIVLIDNVDYEATMWPTLLWLSYAGRRLDGLAPVAGVPPQAANRTMHSWYTEWEAIAVTILGHGPAPAIPAPAVPTSDALIAAAVNLATYRHEEDCLVRGIYMALDLVGTRGVVHNGVTRFLKSDLSPHALVSPQVRDYNFILRALDIYPAQAREDQPEAKTLSTLSPAQRANMCTVYSAIVSTAVTVLLTDVNITTENIVAYLQGDDVGPQLINILTSPMNRVKFSAPNSICMTKVFIARAFKDWIGSSIEWGNYPNCDWLGAPNSYPVANILYGDMVQVLPPRGFTPNAIVTWLENFPVEYGYMGPRPTLSFAKETLLNGPPLDIGWFGRLGDATFNEQVSSKTPYVLVPYAGIAYNAIVQLLRPPIHPTPVAFQQAVAYEGVAWPTWGAPGPQVPEEILGYIPDLFSIQPCTLLTYNYALNTVQAPAILDRDVGIAPIREISRVNEMVSDCVGLQTGVRPQPSERFEICSAFATAMVAPSFARSMPGGSSLPTPSGN
ncbi:MAG: hypothetical protein FNCTV1_gp1 [Hangzhou nephotettix cincticeps totivirus 1]|nr:MAG: hypothetical protein FNCTV1_gp1 [Hangzhou nephotettix cincticeps totivirus 1]